MLISAWELIKKSGAFTREHWKKYLPYAIIGILPSVISEVLQFVFRGRGVLGLAVYFSLFVILWVISIIVGTFVHISAIKLTKTLFNKQVVGTWQQMWQESKPLLVPVFLVGLLYGLIVFVGLVFLIIPGIVFGIWYVFCTYEAVLEKKDVWASFQASKALVAGRWWSVVWRLVAPGLLVGVIALLVILLVGVIVAGLIATNEIVGTFIAEVLSIAIFITFFLALMPFFACAYFTLYEDLKSKPVTTSAQITT